jgi:hypothetical protein
MRSITMIAVAAAISGLLAVAARADDLADSTGNAQTGMKRIYEPDAKMMLRAPGAASLTPGAEKRGLQTVDPAGPAAGEAILPRNQDTPAAAAAAVTTDDARITPAGAAQAIQTQSR